jgi:hypothetical protein
MKTVDELNLSKKEKNFLHKIKESVKKLSPMELLFSLAPEQE